MTLNAADIPITDLLLAVHRFWEQYRAHPDTTSATPDIAISGRFPVAGIMARMEQLEDEGYIESGVSLRTAWLTQLGVEYLRQAYPDLTVPEYGATEF